MSRACRRPGGRARCSASSRSAASIASTPLRTCADHLQAGEREVVQRLGVLLVVLDGHVELRRPPREVSFLVGLHALGEIDARRSPAGRPTGRLLLVELEVVGLAPGRVRQDVHRLGQELEAASAPSSRRRRGTGRDAHSRARIRKRSRGSPPRSRLGRRPARRSSSSTRTSNGTPPRTGPGSQPSNRILTQPGDENSNRA